MSLEHARKARRLTGKRDNESAPHADAQREGAGLAKLPVYPSTDFRLRNNEEYEMPRRFLQLGRVMLAALIVLSGSRAAVSADQPLPPDEAFRFKASFRGADTVLVEIVPAENHYLYKDKLRFHLKNANGVSIKELRLPPGEKKNDPFFGLIEVYKAPVRAVIVVNRASKATEFTLFASYQGCNEKIGLCYPPIEKLVDLKFPK